MTIVPVSVEAIASVALRIKALDIEAIEVSALEIESSSRVPEDVKSQRVVPFFIVEGPWHVLEGDAVAIEAVDIAAIIKEAFAVTASAIEAPAIEAFVVETIAVEPPSVPALSINTIAVVPVVVKPFSVDAPLIEALIVVYRFVALVLVAVIVISLVIVIVERWIIRDSVSIQSGDPMKPVLIIPFRVPDRIFVMRTAVRAGVLAGLPIPSADQAKLRRTSAGHVVASLGLVDPAPTRPALLPSPFLLLWERGNEILDDTVDDLRIANMLLIWDDQLAAPAAGNAVATGTDHSRTVTGDLWVDELRNTKGSTAGFAGAENSKARRDPVLLKPFLKPLQKCSISVRAAIQSAYYEGVRQLGAVSAAGNRVMILVVDGKLDSYLETMDAEGVLATFLRHNVGTFPFPA